MLLMEDRALLEAFRRGDEAALKKVYEHYLPTVQRLLRGGFSFSSGRQTYRFRGHGSAFELQDAVQETFLKAFRPRAREGFSGVQPYGPYLLGIARNLVIDEFRRRRREMALFVPEQAEVHLARSDEQELTTTSQWTRRGANPELGALRRQQNALLKEFLKELDAEHQRLINLRFVQGLTQEETALEMALDRNRVRRMVKELRLRLLRFMKRRGQINALDARELIGMLSLG